MSTQRRCIDLVAVLSAYVDLEATPDEMEILEAHVRSCDGCAARLQRYKTLTPRLEAYVRGLLMNAQGEAPGPVKPALVRRQRNRTRFRDSPGRVLTTGVMVALVVATAMLLGVILMRSAPAGRTVVDTGAQPNAPSAGSTLDPRPPVLIASIEGLVDPAVAAYVHRAVSAAEVGHAAALVVVLDASGGLDGPVQQVAQELGKSSVPTLAFVAPGQTNAVNTGLARSSDVVADATALNVDAFLLAADGHEARTPAGPIVLATAGARTETLQMEPLEGLAHRLMDPTIAYLLFVLGLYAVFVELAHPGSLLPGATGVVCLTLASGAFAMLPTNWLGVIVLVAAVGLMALELKAATHGALVLSGVVCLVVGSVLLYAAPGSLLPEQGDVTIAPAVLIGAAGTGLIVGLLLARIARRIRSLPPILSLDQLIGTRGVSRSVLDPEGVVHAGGQLWSARLRGVRLESGEPIRVVARHGLVLEVESAALGAATRKGTLS